MDKKEIERLFNLQFKAAMEVKDKIDDKIHLDFSRAMVRGDQEKIKELEKEFSKK